MREVFSVSGNWRLQKERYGLVGEICGKCGTKIFPIKLICPTCQHRGLAKSSTPEVKNYYRNLQKAERVT